MASKALVECENTLSVSGSRKMILKPKFTAVVLSIVRVPTRTCLCGLDEDHSMPIELTAWVRCSEDHPYHHAPKKTIGRRMQGASEKKHAKKASERIVHTLFYWFNLTKREKESADCSRQLYIENYKGLASSPAREQSLLARRCPLATYHR